MLNPLLQDRPRRSSRPRRGGRGRDRGRSAASPRSGSTTRGVADRYPFQLSGGMRQRVGIAAALASDPELLIADEPSTALDVTTQKEILALLRRVQEARGMGLVLITHDLRVAFSICRRIYVLYAGSVLEVAPAADLEREPLHPYTLGLLLSEPSVERRLDELAAIEGSVPAPDEVAGRCPFATAVPVGRAAVLGGRSAAPRGRAGPPVGLRAHRRDPRRAGCKRAGAGGRGAHARPSSAVRRGGRRSSGSRSSGSASAACAAAATVAALAGVSIEVGEGESVGLVGESGSGKTTLARCLVGLETPTAGRIAIDGIDASDYSRLEPAARRQLRRSVQMVFQDPYSSLNPVRTVGATLREALAVGPDPRDDGRRPARARRAARATTRRASRSRSPAASASGSRSHARSRSSRG